MKCRCCLSLNLLKQSQQPKLLDNTTLRIVTENGVSNMKSFNIPAPTKKVNVELVESSSGVLLVVENNGERKIIAKVVATDSGKVKLNLPNVQSDGDNFLVNSSDSGRIRFSATN